MKINSELILLILFFIILGILLCEFISNPEYKKNNNNNKNKNNKNKNNKFK